MSDRLFAECCYGTEDQHLPEVECPQTPAARARLHLADVLDLAGFFNDAEHLRKPARVGEVILSHSIAVAAMLSFAAARDEGAPESSDEPFHDHAACPGCEDCIPF